jgi:hypothetical protein
MAIKVIKTAPKKSKTGLIIGISLIAITGIGLLIWYFHDKNKKELELKNGSSSETNTDGSAKNPSADDSGVQTTIKTSTNPMQVVSDKPTDVLAFQKFANSKGWSPKLKEDGIFGSKTGAAWVSLKSDYNKSATNVTSTTPKKITVDSFASTNPSLLIGKKAYSINSAVNLNDVLLQKVGTAKKDEFVGTITKMERISSGAYWTTVVSPLGQVYKVYSSGLYILG